MIKEKEKGNLIVLSGPSGCGKGTIISKLKEINNNIWLSISMTSRKPRSNDIEDVTYYFVSKDEFIEKINNNYFLEYAEYNGNYYGTPIEKINDKLNKGKDVILEIEIQGALQIKQLISDAIFIFVLPPSMKELKKRLVNRNTESIDVIIDRFKKAYNEINEVTKYNYVVINDELDETVKKINAILVSEKCRCDRIEELYLNNEEEYMHEMLLEDKEMPNKVIEVE